MSKISFQAYPSLKPLGSWIQDLKLRIQQFQVWCSTVDPPEKFWLPGFTSPKSILNAALLTTVKNSDVSINYYNYFIMCHKANYNNIFTFSVSKVLIYTEPKSLCKS